MPLGLAVEEPITSYFHRVSTRRNHKHNPPTTKRKRSQTRETGEANEPQKPRTRQKLAVNDAPRNRSGGAQPKTRLLASKRGSSSARQTASHASRTSSSTSQGTPVIEVKPSSTIREQNGGVEDGGKQCDSLQTPPPTIRPRRKYSSLSSDMNPISLTATNPRPSPSPTAVISLPTPVTVSRRTSAERVPFSRNLSKVDVSALSNPSNSTQPHSHIFANEEKRVSGNVREGGHNQGRNGDTDPFGSPSASRTPVLSSQSQHVDLDILPLPFVDRSPVLTFRLPQIPERNLPGRISVGDSEDDGFIHSSQSQHILPHYVSPRRRRANSVHSRADEYMSEEVIPSSQSQTEKELSMSTQTSASSHEESGGCGHTEGLPYRHELPSAGSLSCLRPPCRPLPDQLFPVPIQAMGFFDGGMSDGFKPAQMDPVDSATEDESDDELPTRRTCTTGSMGILSGCTLDTVALSKDDEALQETAEYIDSLPNTVQDFEVMFEESSGSFLHDFRISLQ